MVLNANTWQSGRGHLAIYNWNTGVTTTTVNLSSVVGASGNFKLMDPKNFYGSPVYTGSTDGSGNASIPDPNRFNAYIVLATSGAPSNTAPTVTAGSNQTITLPTNSVTLSGTVSDDGLPNPPASTTCTWSKNSGPGTVTFGNANAASTTATFSTSGSYVLRLTASDSNLSSYAQCTIIVNLAPTANAGGNQAITWPTNTLTLGGSISDDGLPSGSTTCTWSKTSGPGTVTFGSVNAASSTATFSTTGTYVVRLTASDTVASVYNEATISVNTSGGGGAQRILIDVGSPSTGSGAGWNNFTVQPTWSIDGNNVYLQENAAGTMVDSNNNVLSGVAFGVSNLDDVRTDSGTTSSYGADGLTYPLTATEDIAQSLDATQGNASGPTGYSEKLIVSGLTGTSYTVRLLSARDNGGTRLGYFRVNGGAIQSCDSGNAPALLTFSSVTPTGITCGSTNLNNAIQVEFWGAVGGYTDLNLIDIEAVVSGGNNPPTVSAGNNQTIVLPAAATLSGTVSDDGQPNPPAATTCTWSKNSGPGTVTFGNQNAASTTATFSVSGTYVLTLTASDSNKTASSNVTITADGAPTANAGGNRSITLPTNSLTLSGSISDDGIPAACTCTWSKTSGPGTVTFGSVNAASSTATFSTSGTYVVRLTVTDTAASTYDEATITVNSQVNTAPTVSAGSNQTVTLPTAATLSGTVSDDGLPNPPAATTCTWSKNSGPGTVTFGNPNAASTTATFSVSGTYVLTLTASDSNLSASSNVTIKANGAPTANAGVDQSITLPTNSLTLAGTISDDGLPSGSTTCTWSKTSGPGTVTFGNVNAANTTATFSAIGTYVVRLTVTDSLASTYDEATIIVNTAPTANAGVDQSITLPTNSVTLSGSISDDGIPAAATCTWSKTSGPGTVTFGNANAASTTATFSVAGTYVVRLTANDTLASVYDEATIIVNGAPTANAGVDQEIAWPTNSVTLAGTISDDGIPAAATCTWSKTSGPGSVTFGNANAASTTATFSTTGTYVVRLTVTDTLASTYDEATITVDPNSGPTKTAWLKLDEGSGSTASDSSGNGHTGTLYSSPSWISGKFSNALSFNGSSSYMGISNFSLNSSFSISFWFKPASGSLDANQGSYHYAFSWGNIPESTNGVNVWFTTASEPNMGTAIRTFASDANGTYMGDSDCLTVQNTTYNFYDGNWHLYTLTFSGTNGRKVYLDGNMKVSDTKDVGHSITLPTGIYVGARSDLNSARFYNGGVDDLRIYNLELASTDVSNIYNGQ